LTKTETGFLKARISYLNGEQLSRFESVLKDKLTK